MKYLILIFILLTAKGYSQNEFVNPLAIPMLMSGSFAELRSNHFHSGIDIKTNEKTGFPVYAIQDGWVSRIKISPWGYGNAIYIDHPSGYTSVYAHLEGFGDAISKIVLEEQYRKRTFGIDKYFEKNEIVVKQSEVIAYSGNSGGSGGPHLHFELREQKSQNPINPLQFDFSINDTIPPVFKSLVVYDSNLKTYFNPLLKNNQYIVNDTIFTTTDPQFGIITHDISNHSENPLGVNRIQCFIDDKLIYEYDNSKFSFSESRYINAHIDYEIYKTEQMRVQKLFREPGNALKNYKSIAIDNSTQLPYNKCFKYRVEIEDSKSNKSVLSFIVLSNKKESKENLKVKEVSKPTFYYQKENQYFNDDLLLTVKKGSLYYDFNFSYDEKNDARFLGNKVFVLHQNTVPVHRSMPLRVKIPNEAARLKKSQLLIVRNDGSSLSAESTKTDGLFLTADIRTFGDYAISIDSVAPKIELKSIDFEIEKGNIVCKISDNLSGIDTYNGYIDLKWVLFKYDPKTNTLYYDKDAYINKKSKPRSLLIQCNDAVGNSTSFEYSFTY